MAVVKYGNDEWEVQDGMKLADVAKEKGIPAVAGVSNGKAIGLGDRAEGIVELVGFNDPRGKEVFWHTCAHVLAYAVRRLYPEAKPTIGPPVDEGFYYDFWNLKIGTEQFPEIEKEISKILSEGHKMEKIELTPEQAKEMFKDNPFKLELIDDALSRGERLTAYRLGDFVDLCRGPHLPNVSMIGAIKLTKIGAAYWKGDSSNPQLLRIYGIGFPSRKEMEEWEKMQEEIRKRDHRRIGEELDLYHFNKLSPGTPTFHWKGWRIYRALENYIRELTEEQEYLEVRTPILWNTELWKQSGHWDHYKDDMYFVEIDKELYGLKPMNCPAHCQIYKRRSRSYRELPLRISEFGHVHRHELSGVLSGLFRVRAFTQDDAHLFVREDQIADEIRKLLELVGRVYSTFGFEFQCMLSTRPEKYMGSLETWEKAEKALKDALEDAGFEYEINEGDGAFYGPKIDIRVRDSIGRWWQCATIQLDFQMPERFDLRYMGEDGTDNHRPVMIHRAIYGSLERFMGILIENYAGKLPLWLSPEQVRIIPVNDDSAEYAMKVRAELKKRKFWAEVDLRDASMGKKIREAQLDKVNYIIVVGQREMESGTVSVRERSGKFNVSVPLAKLIENLEDERSRRLQEPDISKWK